jgi:hypothetical protein
MAIAKTRAPKQPSQPAVVHSWTSYDFYAISLDYSLGGCIEMPFNSTPDDTTRAVMCLFAQSAHEAEVEIDPFNARIIIRKVS